jgi:osmotically-inducible protein OsmY
LAQRAKLTTKLWRDRWRPYVLQRTDGGGQTRDHRLVVHRGISLRTRWPAGLAPSSETLQQPQGTIMTHALLRRTAAIALVAGCALLSACASTSKSEGTGEYVDDTVITTKVKAAVLNDPTLKSAEINVETFKGVVQLSGFVNSQADINQAVTVARGVTGVKSVSNGMKLK